MYDAQSNGNGRVAQFGPLTQDSNEAFIGTADEPQLFSPKDPIRVLWQRLWVIVLVVVLVVGLAMGFTLMQTPTYGASIKVLVGQKQGGPADNLVSEVQGLQGITETVATAITTRPVAEGVVQRLDLPVSPEQIQGNVEAEVIGTSQFIEISYEDTDPDRAQLVVNTLGDVFSQQVAEISSDNNNITATVWERAVSSSLLGPSMMRNALLALVLGTMIGVGLAFLLDYLDDDWKSPEEVERIAGIATLGMIPTFRVKAPKSKGGN